MRMRPLLPFFILTLSGFAAEGADYKPTLEQGLAILRSASIGTIAFCKPSVVDELQIIGEPRELGRNEARALGELLGADDTYFDRTASPGLLTNSMCDPHWDFKILLSGDENQTVVAIRLCSGCRQIAMLVNEMPVHCPDIRKPAMLPLTKYLDSWFPKWQEVTKQNRAQWELHIYNRSRRMKNEAKSQDQPR